MIISPSARQVILHPVGFVWRVLRGFAANQGLLLAGAIAYYALLSLVPLLILSVILLSHLVDQALLIETLTHYLEWLVPSQSSAVLSDISRFLESRAAIGAVLFITMLFFSSLAFAVVEKAMAVIFAHRHAGQKRHALISAVLPYMFVFSLVILLLFVSGLGIAVQTLAEENIQLFGRSWSLMGLSAPVRYLLGLSVETLIFAALYMIMPVGNTRLRHALFGGFTAALLWEATRHGLSWYFTSISKASIVYGSLTTSVVVLLSMEFAATLLLLGAQVIAEYEKIGSKPCCLR
ncbi:MAG: YihY/virulence factor BrkB family protein [Azonexus sp.]